VGTSRFKRSRSGALTLTVETEEAPVLRGLLAQLAELVAPDDDPAGDPLDALVGIGTSTEPPDDPVLARLLPDAYADDPQAAGEFRRYTERTLRERKLADATTALATLDRPGEKRPLTGDEAHAWLGALNDLRLALGTRLEVTETWEEQARALAPDDPALPLFAVYEWLGWLQAELVGCLAADLPPEGGPARG
jgi:hypothetical protein